MSISDRPEEEGQEGKEDGDSPPERHDQFSPPSDVHGTSEGTQTVCEGAEPERRETEQQQAHVEKRYTERPSSATMAIADKAAHAKEAAVGSAEYGKKIAEAVNEKVAGAGSAVVSSTVSQQREKKGQREGASGEESGAGEGKAKSVSMREYLAEKLSPGEEDRALCEVISEAIQKRKEEERDVREEEEEKKVSGDQKAGKGVVAKIKGAVSTLLGGSRHAPPPTQATSWEATDSSRVEQEGG